MRRTASSARVSTPYISCDYDKTERLFLSATFTAKIELVFVLTQENKFP